MRIGLVTTGTELLLGDVRDSHLSFIAGQLLPLGLRIGEQRTLPDGDAIREALTDLFPKNDIIFVTGGLGPTTDDITREVIAALLSLELHQDETVLEAILERLTKRRIPFTNRISRQAQVPRGAIVLPNENGTAPGFYLRHNISETISSPALFVLPGPPRELQPMFRSYVRPLLRSIVPAPTFHRRLYRIVNMGESMVERAIGQKILALPDIELGYCARPGEVDLRVIGSEQSVRSADEIITATIGDAIFSTSDKNLEQVLVKCLTERQKTLAIAESCTGGLLANRITNVPGASNVLVAGYVTYANEAKMDMLGVDRALIQQHGAVSEPIARAMAEGARNRAHSDFALSTTGIAGPDGGSAEKPVGTVFVGLAAADAETIVKKCFFPNDRETFKYQTAQVAFDMLRKTL